ncbi:MAG: hypothetical protein IJ971_01605 [Bacteroidales bacterium]|nr:hypothetical protein [Bacteroidales bacterium]
MKDTLRTILMAMLAIVLTGCGKDPQLEPEKPEPEKPELNQNLAFTLEVAEVGAYSAKINVSHNGASSDTWYCFTTTNSNINEAISEKYTELTSAPSITGLKKQKSFNAVLNGLEPETSYAFIAFGISEEGELYGKAASVNFTTAKGEVVMEANKAWNVTYTGTGKINDQEYKHTITVTSTDNNKYFITGYDKASFETYDIKDIAETELEYLKRWIKEYNATNGTKLTLDQMLFEGDGIDALNFTPGDWYAIAIGVDDEGEISGLYAVSDVITIEEEEPTEAYASWLGDWVWTGSNGVAWEVSFEKELSNISYYLKGWEDGYGPEIPVEWDPEKEMWAIYTYNYGEYDFGNNMKGDIYILGTDGTYIYPIEGLPICAGMTEEDGNRVCFGYSEETEDGVVIISHMQYIAAISGSYYMLSETQEWPTFPITITPASKVTKSAESQPVSVQTFTNAPRIFKTYYKSYCEAVK